MPKLVGHEDQLNNLYLRFTSKNLSNSTILFGPKGIGKRTFVNDLICKIIEFSFNNNNFKHHINLFYNNTHPNIKLITRENDIKTKKLKSNITIDQIRNLKQFINETSSIRDLNKFIIFDSVDDLNINSSNSFLKTLEEPKSDTFLFLISHQISSLLPTVRSRCLKIKLNNHNKEQFSYIIKQKIENISDDSIQFFYEITKGSPGIAISLFDHNIIDLFDRTINFLFDKKLTDENLILCDTISKFDNDKFKNYLSILKSILIFLNKIKLNSLDTNEYLSKNFKRLISISNTIPINYIINKLDFLSNNENDLFIFNLDKKLFMLNFLRN